MCVGIEEKPTKCFIFTKDDDKPPSSFFYFYFSIVENNEKLKGSLLSYGFFLGL
jgi:hypothetical protein